MGNVFNMVGGAGGGIKLNFIAITAPPSKTTYISGELFDSAGMSVEATYSNGATLIATGWSYTPTGPILDGVSEITIIYTEGGISKEAKQSITVLPALSSISVSTKPTKLQYEYGQSLDTTNMVVSALYSDGSISTITGYTVSPDSFSGLGEQTVTITYTEHSNTKSDSFTVTVEPAVIDVPTQSGSLTYNEAVQTPTWIGYDPAKMAISGDTSAMNAGSYSASFTPTINYKWSDGTTDTKAAVWSIGKAAGSLTISPTSLTINTSSPNGTIQVTRLGDGAISAVSSNTSVVTTSVSGNTVNVNNVGQKNGSATITVKVSEGTNYTAPPDKTCTVTASFIDPVLNNNSWSTISALSANDTAKNYFKVGDTKRIEISGRAGDTAFAKLQIDAFIVGFNHNPALEGSNKIHFQIGKMSGVDVGLVDSLYSSSVGVIGYFSMNDSAKNSGGWAACEMHETILGSSYTPTSPKPYTLLGCLPIDLRSEMKNVKKCSDNVGGGFDGPNYVTITYDYLPLPSEFEIQGGRTYANSREQNFQKQYDYYKAGNSRVKYKHNNLSQGAYWWTRSVHADTNSRFCIVDIDGSANNSNANYSFALAPLFFV